MCRKVGNIYYTNADNNIRCNSDYYKEIISPVNIGFSILVGILIPLFLFYNLVKNFRNNK